MVSFKCFQNNYFFKPYLLDFGEILHKISQSSCLILKSQEHQWHLYIGWQITHIPTERERKKGRKKERENGGLNS